ncbi:MAG: PorT family protein [Sphingobacteriales bacterium]
MKHLLITAMICAAASGVFAQNSKTDSVKASADTGKNNNGRSWEWHSGNNDDNDHNNKNSHHSNTYPKGFMGITFSRFDLGYAVLTDHGSFTLSPQNQFLDYNQWKTSNVGFDVFQMGVKLTKNFKMYLSGGFDWTLIRLRNNIDIVPGQPVLTWRPDSVHLHKNRLSASYFRVPLSFDFHSDKNSNGDRFNFVFGPEAGLLMNGMLKQVSAADGKQKTDAGYNFTKIRYGAFMRVGYGGWGVFAKYYFNDMFENSPDQKGVKTFSFGLTFGF